MVRPVSEVVHQPEYGSNRTYLIDTIELSLSPQLLNSAKIRQLYLERTMSKAQLAERFGVSESTIAKELRAAGIHGGTGKGRLTDPKNYRASKPPYGYCVKNGELVLHKAEQRVCKLVIELAIRQHMNHSEVARQLTARGLKNRVGSTEWNSKSVFNIVQRWSGKL